MIWAGNFTFIKL